MMIPIPRNIKSGLAADTQQTPKVEIYRMLRAKDGYARLYPGRQFSLARVALTNRTFSFRDDLPRQLYKPRKVSDNYETGGCVE
jgi:hypothetical protein